MRKKGLDLLRAIAVILVIFTHMDLDNNPVQRFGWLGVDLFFVLSGFLVSGLLFSEYKETGTVRINRFLIRRSFKLFPPFYFFMFVTLLVNIVFRDKNYDLLNILSELFYLQNYLPHVWFHTWSLAVEEQFYLLLALSMTILAFSNYLSRRKFTICCLVFLLTLSFGLRWYASYPHRNEASFMFTYTHLRADGIIVGILLGYLYHFTDLTGALLKNKMALWVLSLLLIAPGAFFPGGSFFMNTWGLTFANLGFGLLVLLSLNLENSLGNRFKKISTVPLKIMCFIGVNSYSIYLWHLNCMGFIARLPINNELLKITANVVFSIFIGILMSYAIEKNALKLRDKIWRKPALQSL